MLDILKERFALVKAMAENKKWEGKNWKSIHDSIEFTELEKQMIQKEFNKPVKLDDNMIYTAYGNFPLPKNGKIHTE